MYSKNDYRYYLEHQLMMSDDYLAHYGVMGMKWGVRNDNRIAKLSSRHAKNDAKISKYQAKLNTVSAQKRAAKASKFKAKQSKYDRKAAKARARLAKGKNISTKQMKRIMKAEKYAAKTAQYSYKNDKLQAKINRLTYKNVKLDKKISKLNKPSRAGARAYQRGLNHLDTVKVRSLYEARTSTNANRSSKAAKKYSDSVTNIAKTTKDAKNRGYNVTTRDTQRWVNPAETAAYAVATAALPVHYTNVKHAPGTKYVVKKPKKKR